MLSQDNLQQLKSIKTDIRNNKDLHRAVVRGTRWRYGFAHLPKEGRDILIPNEEMLRVFPGDEVEVNIIHEERKRPYAKIERVFKSPLAHIVGRVSLRKQHCFIQADVHGMQQNLFVPPPFRKKAKDGDYVVASISQHPFKQGKAQAKILEVLKEGDTPLLLSYIKQKYQLPEIKHFDAELPAIQARLAEALQQPQRRDLSHLDFVTIDGAQTRDLDDALYAQPQAEGWNLLVAIADPCELVAAGSAIEQQASDMGSSVYLPQHHMPMLPTFIACDLASLKPAEKRLAIVCDMQVSPQGNIKSCEIYPATICSKAQLSYQDVAAFIDGQQDAASESVQACASVLEHLQAVSTLLQSQQQQRSVPAEKSSYKLKVDSHYQLLEVEKTQQSTAHALVESCMIACNESVARWAVEHQVEAMLFNVQSGFRESQLTFIAQLLQARLGMDETPLNELDAFVSLMQKIKSTPAEAEDEAPLLLILNNLLERSVISTEPQPHFALGVAQYASFTSPIRRYQDFLNHRALKAAINKNTADKIDAVQVDALNEKVQRNRQASQQLDNWLICQLLEKQRKQIYSARIKQMQGKLISVILEDYGIVGNLDMRDLRDFKFNGSKKAYSNEQQTLVLGQAIPVSLLKVDWQHFVPVFRWQTTTDTDASQP